jgi:hypothetical protein
MILIIGVVASHLREEGFACTKLVGGNGFLELTTSFSLALFHTLPISHIGRVHLGISWHGLGNALSPRGDPASARRLLGIGTHFSFLHRIGMERLGGRAWDIHLFSTSESTTAH